MTINWKQLCEDSHANAKEKGFLSTGRTYHGDNALFHSEISEALEDYRNHCGLNEIYYEMKSSSGPMTLRENELEQQAKLNPSAKFKPCGIPIELADVVIRVAQYCGTEHLDLAYAMKTTKPDVAVRDPEEFFSKLHMRFSLVYEEWTEKKQVNEFGLAKALMLMEDFCKLNNIDLEEAVKKKAEYNSGRPYLHGNKKI